MITARYFSSDSSDSGSLRTPCPPPACAAGRQGITPAFGYSAPHPSAGGTLTLLTHALPSTHYEGATTSRSRNPGRLLVRFRAPRDPPVFVLAAWRSQIGGEPTRARAFVQPAAQVPARSHVDMSGISQVPRRSVPYLCPAPRPRPDRRTHGHWRSRRCCPRSNDSEGSSKRSISRLMRGFGTCCLRFQNDVAVSPARLASGWLARLCREGVEPSGSQ